MTDRKGIILAGGKATRLYPATLIMCKQLLPVYDKPMIYYPLSTLMLGGMRDILIISTPPDLPYFERLFGDGSQLGLNFSYKVQEHPRGIAEAFIVGEDFISGKPSCLLLGDNIFHGHGLPEMMQRADAVKEGAVVFGYHVNDPERFGVVGFDRDRKVISIEEKPKQPKSNYAIVGLYFYDDRVIDIAKEIKPSNRGEIEITDVNRVYFEQGKLQVELMGRGFAWLDTGTPNSMADATNYLRTMEERQGLKVACIEEIAWSLGYITDEQLERLAEPMKNADYGKYLLRLLREKN